VFLKDKFGQNNITGRKRLGTLPISAATVESFFTNWVQNCWSTNKKYTLFRKEDTAQRCGSSMQNNEVPYRTWQ
jgi:hypothetical protein